MFNARHILMKPQYTSADSEKAFKTLDSLKEEIDTKAITFALAAKFYSRILLLKLMVGRWQIRIAVLRILK